MARSARGGEERLAAAAILAWLVLVAIPSPVRADEDALPSATPPGELLDRVYRNLYAADFVQVMTLTTRSASGRTMTRRLQVTRKQSSLPGKALVRFLEPPDIRGTSLLVLERDDRYDDVFLYLPAFDRIRRVSSAQRADAFFGTNLTYEDLEPKRSRIKHSRGGIEVADNTLVVFVSDNGWHWGEHRTRAKLTPYEEAIRSPMLVHYPMLAPLPRRESRLALNIDLAPTFAELAGADVPIPQDGGSLVPVLDGTARSWRTDFLAEAWPARRVWAAVRDARWKYVELPLTPGDPDTEFERQLYDLAADPYELENVAGDPQHAARIAAMAAPLRELRPNWPVDGYPNGPDPEEGDPSIAVETSDGGS